jgi:hypothetical protein
MRGPDLDDYSMKAVYSETDFVFHEAIWAIKGSLAQKEYLLNVVGLLNSKLYAYLNLMLGSDLGIAREQRQKEEILSFPYVFSWDIAAQVKKIQEIKEQVIECDVEEDATKEIDSLNRAILEAFRLSDNEFVDYALRIQIPQLTGVNDSYVNQKASKQDFTKYGKYFYDYLSEIFASAGKYIKIEVYPTVAKHYSVFKVVVHDKKPNEWLMIINNSNDNQRKMLAKLSTHRINELFYSLKDVLYFEENSFCIIKPNNYKNWHPAIARLDLNEVTNQILSRQEGGKN